MLARGRLASLSLQSARACVRVPCLRQAVIMVARKTDLTPVPPPIKKFKQSMLQFGPQAKQPFPTSQQSAAGSSATNQAHCLTLTGSEATLKETTSDCFSECCKEALSPYQPSEAGIIEQTRKKQGKKVRQFSPTWYSTYPWLTLCVTTTKAFCTYCRYCSGKN